MVFCPSRITDQGSGERDCPWTVLSLDETVLGRFLSQVVHSLWTIGQSRTGDDQMETGDLGRSRDKEGREEQRAIGKNGRRSEP